MSTNRAANPESRNKLVEEPARNFASSTVNVTRATIREKFEIDKELHSQERTPMPSTIQDTPESTQGDVLHFGVWSDWTVPDYAREDYTFTQLLVRVSIDEVLSTDDSDPTEIATIVLGIFDDISPDAVVLAMDEVSQNCADLSIPFVHNTIELIRRTPPPAWTIGAVESFDIDPAYDTPEQRGDILASVLGRLMRHCDVVLAFADEAGIPDHGDLTLGARTQLVDQTDWRYLGHGVVGVGVGGFSV